jgi:hypothetical protein
MQPRNRKQDGEQPDQYERAHPAKCLRTSVGPNDAKRGAARLGLG